MMMTAIFLPFLQFMTRKGPSYGAKYAVISQLVTSKGACETTAYSTHQASFSFLRIVRVGWVGLALLLALGHLLIVAAVVLTTLKNISLQLGEQREKWPVTYYC
jgi:hypothetical protein